MAIRNCPAGTELEAVSDWESCCWYSDEDVDDLELEIELTAGVKLQRQIVLREERFLLLADAVMSPQPGTLEYRSVLPLAAGVEFRGAAESREGLLVQVPGATASGKSAACRPLAQVLPLGMPEWRAEQRWRVEDDCRGSGTSAKHGGTAALRPLVSRPRPQPIPPPHDLAATHRGRIARAAAVGHGRRVRIAVGDRQWIIYRSLAARGNRTLLGHNLATESLIARFGKEAK